MREVITSVRLFGLSVLLCSAVYPAVILAFAVLVAPTARQGSLVKADDGSNVGSRLLAQKFTRPEYFWPRPSACDYNASATGGSNLSPTSPLLTDNARRIISQLRLGEAQLVPADLVSASGSGMDPHISLAAALLQAPRVADARGVPLSRLQELVRQHIDSPTLAALGGDPIVNVLELNLALDQDSEQSATTAP